MNIYKTLVEHALQGGRFTIDLRKKTLKIGSKLYISEREVLIDDELIGNEKNDPWNTLFSLYDNYKHSIPSARYRNNSYFKALKYECLTPRDMVYGDDRKVAQAKLEGFILLASLNGNLKWEWADKWFWQSERDEDLVVLKEWV